MNSSELSESSYEYQSFLEHEMDNEPTYCLKNSLMEKGKKNREKVDSDLRETMDLIFPLKKSIIMTSVYTR